MTFISVAHAQRAKTSKNPNGIPVLPAVDVNLGTVTFFTPTGHRAYFSADPALLVDALAAAVRPAHWIAELGTLVVTVAQTGSRAGRRLGFKLENY
ncbi:hypothetical protein [Arthrobacter glacialis]|uniref:Uncharacterized protein n=1 Tax=Arthrobacter glacialis TaxID=1664 RepID=A0A2S3ZV27_ARTGL|nr:hypothetical protein [Arthrobacter glacialis]POH60205.1 hypothetical protein CVS28_04485 [Arthrobacter glacialis]POH73033.1 hypothetical protein CVS27_12780 [Arthrobacter glacialis]